mmetsp:Transcript_18957/g.37376  ORF Transcript_18957/g.37376 Transcript_18957/m.37376 type:complete len:558 (+) Transcript_18957:49-1722(+)
MSVAELLDKLGLGDYTSKLVEEGFDTINRLALASEKELEECGLKMGHRKQLLSHLESRDTFNTSELGLPTLNPALMMATLGQKTSRNGMTKAFTEGYLVKEASKGRFALVRSKKRRWFKLDNNRGILTYHLKHDDSSPIKGCHIDLSKARTTIVNASKFCFVIEVKAAMGKIKMYRLYASSKADMDRWMGAILPFEQENLDFSPMDSSLFRTSLLPTSERGSKTASAFYTMAELSCEVPDTANKRHSEPSRPKASTVVTVPTAASALSSERSSVASWSSAEPQQPQQAGQAGQAGQGEGDGDSSGSDGEGEVALRQSIMHARELGTEKQRLSLSIAAMLTRAGHGSFVAPGLGSATASASYLLDATITSAASAGDLRRVQQMVASGVNVNQEERGFSPLMKAACAGHADVVCLLLASGAAVDSLHFSTKRSALMLACLGGSLSTVKALYLQGLANLDLQDEKGNTATMIAAYKKHQTITEFLVSHGANTTLKNWAGETCFDFGGPQAAVAITRGLSLIPDCEAVVSVVAAGREVLLALRSVFSFSPKLPLLVLSYAN